MKSNEEERINLKDLEEYSKKRSKLKDFIRNKRKKIQQSRLRLKKEKPDNTLYNFQTDFFPSFFFKTISLYLIVIFVEVVIAYILYELRFENIALVTDNHFIPYLFMGTKRQIFYKFLWMLFAAYILTPNIEVQATKQGLRINKSMIFTVRGKFIAWLRFQSFLSFLEWKSIKRVKKGLVIFNPCIFLYDEKDDLIGYIFFSLRDKEKFFKFIKENAGEDHPLYQLR